MKKDANSSRPRKTPPLKTSEVPAGVVGMGLMGRSIVACLLSAGHPVTGITSDPKKIASTRRQVGALLREMRNEGLLRRDPEQVLKSLTVSTDYSALAGTHLVVESIIENIDAKRAVFSRVEDVVGANTIIGSNTSSIPVTELQSGRKRPERFIGLHWAEPAHITKFLEIICGNETRQAYAKKVQAWAESWSKEPTLVRRDVRAFITNRCMYALMREAFHLVETGVASIEDVDRSVRNDLGYWITLAGPFRWMDLTGIPAYAAVMKDLNSDLYNGGEVPSLMQKVAGSGAKGVSNARGFYKYTPEEARRWEREFLRFSYDIRKLAAKYSHLHKKKV